MRKALEGMRGGLYGAKHPTVEQSRSRCHDRRATWRVRASRTLQVPLRIALRQTVCGLAGATSSRVTLVQQFADLARQFNWKKWFFQVASVLWEVLCPADSVFRVTRDEQEPHLSPQQLCFFPQLQSIQLRHHDIADHEVDLAGIVLQNSDRLSAFLRRKYGVAAFLQTHGNQSEQGWLVLDHEHRFGAGEDLALHRWRLIFYLQFGHCRRRQVNAEPGALSQGALNGDVPPALPYDAVNRRQPQSRPFALLFGGKEGLEDSGLGLCIYARAVVAHRQHHVVSGLHLDVATGVFLIQLHVGRFNHYLAALRHGIASVHHQVDEDLLDLCRVHFDRLQVRFQHRNQVDVLGDDAAQELVCLPHHGIDVQNFWLEHLPPAEGQQLSRQ